MDPTKFKDVQVKRGYTYHYYYSPAAPGKPTLFFVHGFPSTSADWSRQVAHLQPLGYGIVVPDCLGYGGTSKPTDYKEFRHKDIAQDLVDILDAEGLQSVIGIGHDWSVDRYSNPLHRSGSNLALTMTLAGDPPSSRVLRTGIRNASSRTRGLRCPIRPPAPIR